MVGLTIAGGTMVFGAVSGAHFNPAITIGLWSARRVKTLPAIIYVACDPAALARDTTYLQEMGYHLDDIRAFDLFPMTHHIESVALYTPREVS